MWLKPRNNGQDAQRKTHVWKLLWNFYMKRLNFNCGPEWKGEGETERLQEMEGDGNSDECIQEWGVLKRGKNS